MPQAVPLPRGTYVQYMKVPDDAPRVAPARTIEVKGKKRLGEGRAFHLFGPHAVVLGKWSATAPEERWREAHRLTKALPDGEREDGWGRLIRPDEVDTLAQQFWQEKISEGWNPPVWHWRFYWEALLRVLNNLGIVRVAAYNEVRLTWRAFLHGLYVRLKKRLLVREEEYAPFQVGGEHDADDEGLTI